MNKIPKHLGGHGNICHTDEGLLDFLIKEKNIKSFLDIGCGTGEQVELAEKKGLNSLGIDGDYSIERNCNFLLHDFTMGTPKNLSNYDLGWSIEFLEHVEEKYIDHFMIVFAKCKYIVITFSTHRGPKHFNVQSFPYWQNIFKQYGLKYDEKMTSQIKKFSTMEREFIQNTGSFFNNVNK